MFVSCFILFHKKTKNLQNTNKYRDFEKFVFVAKTPFILPHFALICVNLPHFFHTFCHTFQVFFVPL